MALTPMTPVSSIWSTSELRSREKATRTPGAGWTELSREKWPGSQEDGRDSARQWTHASKSPSLMFHHIPLVTSNVPSNLWGLGTGRGRPRPHRLLPGNRDTLAYCSTCGGTETDVLRIISSWSYKNAQ